MWKTRKYRKSFIRKKIQQTFVQKKGKPTLESCFFLVKYANNYFTWKKIHKNNIK